MSFSLGAQKLIDDAEKTVSAIEASKDSGVYAKAYARDVPQLVALLRMTDRLIKSRQT